METKCKKCQQLIDKRDAKCPHCGALDPGVQSPWTREMIVANTVVWSIVCVLLLSWCSLSTESPSVSTASASACDSGDAQCLGKEAWPEAEMKCQVLIEVMVEKHPYKWDAGFLGRNFSRWKWHDSSKRLLLYRGDRLMLQNVYGGWQRFHYTCVYSLITSNPVDAHVIPN